VAHILKIRGYALVGGEFSSYRRVNGGLTDGKSRLSSNGTFGYVSTERSIA
jgi:hypothetical protein